MSHDGLVTKPAARGDAADRTLLDIDRVLRNRRLQSRDWVIARGVFELRSTDLRMTDLNATLPPAMRRALELLTDPPAKPDVSNGYLDLLGAGLPAGTPAVEAVFASPVGSMVYDNMQALIRRLFSALQQPTEWVNIPPGGIALDVGCGPGTVTASLARASGTDGLALGIDLSQAMLARAVRADAGGQIAFLRADAQRLPLRDKSVDAVVSIAVLQLVPDPAAALAEMARVLRAGGRLAAMVPTTGWAARIWRLLPNIGAHLFGETKSATSSKSTASPACGSTT
jgi:arsenite methyltransferase